jgi:hypothetical protein
VPHHTLLHEQSLKNAISNQSSSTPVTSNAAIDVGLKSSSLLILIIAPNGYSSEARAILDSAYSVSLISDFLAQNLKLTCNHQSMSISSIAGISHYSSLQSVTSFVVSTTVPPVKEIMVSAVIVPKVTRNLPVCSVPF